MSQAVLIPATINLVEKTASYLKAEDKDYSNNIVVFPGKRPSHFLRKILGEKEKDNFIPPRIFSMDEFINFLYHEKLDINQKPLETIDAAAFLFDIQLKTAQRLGKDSFITPDTFLPVGLKIYRDIEECYIEKVSQQAIKTIDTLAGEEIPPQTLKSLSALSYFYDEFYKKVEKEGYSTRAVRYRVVSQRINEVILTDFNKIILAGFFALTSSEKDLLARLRSKKNTLFIFQQGPGIDQKLKDLVIKPDIIKEETGIKNKTGVKPAIGLEPDIHFYKSPDTHGQVFALSQIIKEQLDQGRVLDENKVIVLPASESLFPLIAHSLPLLQAQNIPYNISMGYPVNRTPIFGFLNSLMNLITSMDKDQVYVPDYLKFVLHPHTKNIYFDKRADITRIIFHTIEEILSKKRSRGFLSLKEIEDNPEIFKEIIRRLSETVPNIDLDEIKKHLKNIHQQTIGQFLTFKNTGDFADQVTKVLTFVHNNSTAGMHPYFTPFLESFLEAVHLIATSRMRQVEFKTKTGYFNLLKRYIMTRRIPFQGTPLKGLQVLGFLETRNLKFNEVFIFDVNEEVIPNTRREDTLLPYKARKELGLPTYRDRENLVNYYLDLLINSADKVHLFFVEKDKKTRSRFIEKLLWRKQKKDKQITDKNYIKSIQYVVKLTNPDPLSVGKTEDMVTYLKDRVYSATSLDTYLRCPLQFYYKYVLGLEEKKEITGDIQRMDIGILVHWILKDYFEARKGRPLTKKDLDLEEIDRISHERLKADYGDNLSGPAYLLSQQVKRRMKEFITDYQLPLIAEPITILELEYEIDLTLGPFKLTGKIDRIEKRGNKTVIIDYKTSGNNNYLKLNWKKLDLQDRLSWPEAVKTVQLGFYLLLYSKVSGQKIEQINPLFLLLGKAGLSPLESVEVPLFAQADAKYIRTHYEIIKTIILKLMEEIVDPKYVFSPTLRKKDHCPLCPFTRICGTQWIKR
ncbi:MAG: PD-(D/E)XK nuclease family protein [Candidatus Omnitrophica bacterium]|nr:PD-(D/E)XK nuclease family protein [Candidatus Omnitrophota bacterium]